MFFEVYLGNHHAVATATEVSAVTEFLREQIAGVDDARDVLNSGKTKLMGFANVVLFEVDMFGAFVGHGRRPLDTSVVVVVDGEAAFGVGNGEIKGTISDML